MTKQDNNDRYETELGLSANGTDDFYPESSVNTIARAQVLRADAMSQVSNALFEWMKKKAASWRAQKRARSEDGAVSRDRIINATQL
jgi:hypothetical protein